MLPIRQEIIMPETPAIYKLLVASILEKQHTAETAIKKDAPVETFYTLWQPATQCEKGIEPLHPPASFSLQPMVAHLRLLLKK